MEKENMMSSLDKMGIFELREFARQVGVVSPTTKKRAELIEQIKAVTSGEIKADNSVKKGRPPKSVKSVASYYEMLIPEELKKEDKISQHFLVFKNNSENNARNGQVKGYLRKTTSNNYYLKNENYICPFKIIYVPIKLIENKFDIGDYICGNCTGCDDKIYAMMTDLNGTKSYEKICDFNDICETTVKIDGMDIAEGERLIAQDDDVRKFFTQQESLSKSLLAKGYEVVYLASNLPNEIYALAKFKVSGKHFLSLFEDNCEVTYDNASILIDYVTGLVCRGQKVVLFVYDIMQLINALDLYFGSNGKIFVKDHTVEAVQIMKKILALGRSVVGGGSVTVVAKYNQIDEEYVEKNFSVIATRKGN